MRLTFAAVALLAAPLAATAQENFFAGKTVNLYIGSGAGGGYDLYGRVVARHLPRHIKGNPAVVASNMPGAGSIVMTNFMMSAAPKDGTALGIPMQQIREDQLLGNSGARFDVTKFNWLGRISSNVECTYVWHTSPVQTLEDLRTRETTFAGTGATSLIYPKMLAAMTDQKWKVIPGYITTAPGHLAMERGEVEGASSSLNTLRTTTDYLEKKKVRVIIQYADERHPDLPDVPTPIEVVNSPEDKAAMRFYTSSGTLGRSLFTTPGVPADRVAELRSAFMSLMKDPEFLREIEKAGLEYAPLPGAEVQTMIERSVDVSPAVLAKAKLGQMQ
jgi:tripartite-type tricarboxylate transporter receptor subunit TctC